MKKTLSQLLYQGGYHAVVAVLLAFTIYSCRTPNDPTNPADNSKETQTYSAEVALKWSEMSLKLIRQSPGFTPPVASRALGYAGLTLYESVVPGIKSNRSLAGQLNGLKTLPQPEAGKEYHWAASANAAQLFMAKNLWSNAPEAAKKMVDSLAVALRTSFLAESNQEVIERSEAFGNEVAKAIFEWSKSDGGHEGFTRNFPADYKAPTAPGSWQPTENGRTIPMQPYWGKNRTFLAVNSSMPMPLPLTVSTQVNSPYFQQYYDVYKKNIALTQLEKEIAVWWADDPSETFTPPGHSYNIARIAIKNSNAKLDKAAEALARTGIAVADAFTLCWKCKFAFNNERPYTFVRRAIDPKWIPFWPAPPFPGYSSGHSTQSSASAVALEAVFGPDFAFVDDSHVNRVRDTKRSVDFKPRSFQSLWAAAEESAKSRFLGGIHTFQDNDTGLKEGRKIGQNINALRWKQ
ncbi:phosphatase PAP2 family protein [Runella sp. CRIBMP]|uniref:vanadium-dependent haloperoxidase n=1 Tax=Runella sp. CRIBMP TaxID=2683261 RepID=UPI0014120429|nr:vanadium-dependent haloperoxidase [Runella sp. CRIBMP]NBB18157.1 phosphatase PAP2 family protein [Runella sp. CRIBMP]